jgi:hypothetical protein
MNLYLDDDMAKGALLARLRKAGHQVVVGSATRSLAAQRVVAVFLRATRARGRCPIPRTSSSTGHECPQIYRRKLFAGRRPLCSRRNLGGSTVSPRSPSSLVSGSLF